MRIAILLCLVAAVVGCGVGSAARTAEPALTDLKITVWPGGQGEGESESYTLQCAPARGSLSKATSACAQLLKMVRPFRPVPSDAMCTDQFGGPQQALVTGTLKGRSVRANFSATNGCQISRARRVSFLLPGFSGAAAA